MTLNISAQDVEVMKLDNRFQELLDLLKRLTALNIDLKKLRELLDALIKVQELMVLEDKIKAAMDVLRIMTEMTSTEIDDKIFETVNELMTDEMVKVIAKLIRQYFPVLAPAIGAASVGDVTPEDEAAVAAKGIPWGMILKLVPVIAGVIEAAVKS